MTRLDWITYCASLCRASEPLTEAERVEFDCLRAAEMARAEARRTPSPQLGLEPCLPN